MILQQKKAQEWSPDNQYMEHFFFLGTDQISAKRNFPATLYGPWLLPWFGLATLGLSCIAVQ